MTTFLEKKQKASQTRDSLRSWLGETFSNLSTSDYALFNLWGGYGSGKTKILSLLDIQFNGLPDTCIIGPLDANLIPYHEISSQIKTAVEAAPSDHKKVIFIDNLESVNRHDGEDRPDFMEFETQLVGNLIQSSDVMFVITSQHELFNWHYMEIRLRQLSIPLPPIDKEEIKQIAKEAGLSAQDVYSRTYGFPVALAYLRHNPGANEKDIDQHIVEKVLNRIAPNVQEAALISSLLLDFDVAVLKRAANAAGIDLGQTYSDYTTLIQKLAIAGFITHDIRDGGYRFVDQSIRRLLSRIYKSQQPIAFNTIHQEMKTYYQNEARRTSFLHQFLVNAIYHIVWSNEQLEKEQISEICQEWIDDSAPYWVGADWEKVILSWKTGRGNPAITEELTSLLGQKIYCSIENRIESARRY